MEEGKNIALMAVALGGSFVYAFFHPDRTSIRRGIWQLVCGVVISMGLSPAICRSQEWHTDDKIAYCHAVSFLTGFLGTAVCRQLLEVVESQTANILIFTLRRFFGDFTLIQNRPKESSMASATVDALRDLGIPSDRIQQMQLANVNIDEIWQLVEKYKDQFGDPKQVVVDLFDLITSFSYFKLLTFFTTHGREIASDVQTGERFVNELTALLRKQLTGAAGALPSFKQAFQA